MKIQHKTLLAPAAPARARYPTVDKQLAAIVKMAAALRAQGFEMPAEVTEWLDECAAVKKARKTAA